MLAIVVFYQLISKIKTIKYMFKSIKKIFCRSIVSKNQDYFIPVSEQEQNNPNIKKVYVGGLTVDEMLSKV